ncbi:geranylgeranylglycerol-phosphate geranylgeranyltransferase [Christiangramia sp. SM2212]|uniref:Geranylgeranylglycerol-phosphate geranylgeranyltransferase n=1 Tax=Christiangramia sediminicola TaxID=3073267 RepID=A0ABU1EPV8_9FLAO|nr:geranylgeranylglycerol-phosphate geranylgeranyltransferase [Christiangramia sp. SM2212]MDR5590429.1 geranylgeranylglycerol-phosphate geranylgeranyltransferase [Christiangramia sp. SM2212]
MLHFLKLIRAGNLIFIALTMFLIKYGLFEPFGVAITLNLFGFSMLVLAVVSVAASGYVINDIFDVPADLKNKPKRIIINNHISEKTAYRVFFILSIIGVGLGFYLSNMIGRPGFSAFFIFGSAILYIYTSQLQQTILVGNILVSIIVGLIPIGVGLYDLLPAITPQNQQTQSVIFSILIDYSIFAFLVNLLREIVKDQEDIDGDYNAGYKTLPIVFGKNRTNKILFLVGLLPVGFLIYYVYEYLFENISAVIYVLLLLLGPLLFFLINIWTAEKKSEYSRLSTVLKAVLFFGLISIGLLQFILL